MEQSKVSGNTSTGAYPSPMNSSGPSSGFGDTAQPTSQTVQDTVTRAFDQIQQQGKAQFTTQKDAVANTVNSVAQALHQTSSQLQEGHAEPFTQLIDQAASEMERFSTHLRESDVDTLFGEVQDFARRQPAVFVGGAFLFGMFAARMLRTGAPIMEESVGYQAPLGGTTSQFVGGSERPPDQTGGGDHSGFTRVPISTGLEEGSAGTDPSTDTRAA